MKHLKIFLSLFVTIFALQGCADDDLKNTQALIRISNVSTFDYKNITVNSADYKNLNSGEKSEYKLFEKAYRYGFVELEINGEIYTIQPIDYVGESPLEKGKYTYQIDANDSTDQYGKLNLTLVVEE
ncbi:hypothetical protein [Flavisericum labens]|uniref:hypothetical protein n=1 Tax=Flavisericum labens TaxID=3377112 RepID=UPI00387B960A